MTAHTDAEVFEAHRDLMFAVAYRTASPAYPGWAVQPVTVNVV